MQGHSEKVGFIWSVADLLRGDYKASDYGKVILPLVVLRRLDCVLEGTKDAVISRLKTVPETATDTMRETVLNIAAGQSFHNLSAYTFARLKAEPDQLEANLLSYLNGFSANIRDIFIDRFELPQQIARLEKANLLFLVISKFAEIDLHPDKVSNLAMGYIFEELIRRFSEQSNETAGEHFTPREVIRLMVNLLLVEDSEALAQPGAIRTIYDPACGTGGMLSVAEEYVRELNPSAKLVAFGQELNPETYGVCKSDMLIKGQNPDNIGFGNSFTEDRFPQQRFDYCISNPPFGVEWKKVETQITDEHERFGLAGRFGAGLPRVSDGSLLFIQHMISKFRNDGGVSRLAVVLNGSPLFTGGAGSGESEIRRWIIENDWLEAIIGLPNQLFYNTGISTYLWIITNKKSPERKGKVQLIDATSMFEKMRRSLGNKRNQIGADHIKEITRLFGDMADGDHSKVFDNEEFGYWRTTVEQPLRLSFALTTDRMAEVTKHKSVFGPGAPLPQRLLNSMDGMTGESLHAAVISVLRALPRDKTWLQREDFQADLKKAFKQAGLSVHSAYIVWLTSVFGKKDPAAEPCRKGARFEPDPDLRDTENVPLKDDIQAYFEREVRPHVPDAWIDEDKTKKGYEIPFTRHFYRYTPPRPLAEIDADLKRLSGEIQAMLREIAA